MEKDNAKVFHRFLPVEFGVRVCRGREAKPPALCYYYHMFRTRDFALIFVAIVLLLVAIGTTLWYQHQAAESDAPQFTLADTPDITYEGEVVEPQSLSREARLEEMRRKIADSSELAMTAPTIATKPVEETLVAEESTTVTSEPINCANYAAFAGYWSPQGVSVEVVEGARVFYRTLERDVVAEPGSTTTLPDSYRVVLAQLPVQPIVEAMPNCLASDVVGIAQDGSLIRNSEATLYSVFGSETLIGYALDGLPIYGVSQTATDMCGGAFEAGQYRYYLSEKREVVLNCFVAPPTSL